MKFLEKLQKQPEYVRKLILWTIIVIVGIGLAIFWIWSSHRRIEGFSKEKFIEEFNLPFLKSKIDKLPKIEISPAPEKELKKEEEK